MSLAGDVHDAEAALYLNFDLVIDRQEQVYRAQVIDPATGEFATATFAAPFTASEFEDLADRMDRSRGRTRSATTTTNVSLAKELGGRLYEAVLVPEIRSLLGKALDKAEKDGAAGVRIRLHLDLAPDLAVLPWEFIYDADPKVGRFLVLAEETPLVRYLNLAPRNPVPVSPPLRVLVVVSNPKDDRFPELDVARESRLLEEALGQSAKGLVQIKELRNVTFSALQDELQNNSYHVLHYIGHGTFDEKNQDGLLWFAGERGGAREVTAQLFGELLYNEKKTLGLAVLNACEGGRASATDPYAGMAQTLVKMGVPAVVAMQFEISDDAAIRFARQFYRGISLGRPIDAALTDARMAIRSVSETEWATPVLYMRSPDGRIFDIPRLDPAAVSAIAAAPPPRVELAATAPAQPATAAPTAARTPTEARPSTTAPPASPAPAQPRAGRFLYQNFDVEVRPADKGYVARVTASPAGQASSQFAPPLSVEEVATFQAKLRRLGTLRSVESTEPEFARGYGERLFNGAFGGEMATCLRKSLALAGVGTGLRIRLQLAAAPELANHPWEYLFDPAAAGGNFLALSNRTPIVRFVATSEPSPPVRVALPLRVLVMVSRPMDDTGPDFEREWQTLATALKSLEQRGLVAVERLPVATLSALQEQLQGGSYNVFHFVGHAVFDEKQRDGFLVLADSAGGARKVSARQLTTMLRDAEPTQLAVLNACEGGVTAANAFSDCAETLVAQGIPAVVAMQPAMSDAAAMAFSTAFYWALSNGIPADGAVAEARKAVYGEVNELEWGTPVLFMRATDGHLFDIDASAPRIAAATATLPAAPAPPPAAPSAPSAVPGPSPAAPPAGSAAKAEDIVVETRRDNLLSPRWQWRGLIRVAPADARDLVAKTLRDLGIERIAVEDRRVSGAVPADLLQKVMVGPREVLVDLEPVDPQLTRLVVASRWAGTMSVYNVVDTLGMNGAMIRKIVSALRQTGKLVV